MIARWCVVVTLCVFSVVYGADTFVWREDVDVCLAESQQQAKPVYLYFTGSSWCMWCKRMDQEIHSQAAFQHAVAGACLFVRIEVPGGEPSVEVRSLMDRYAIRGVPTVVICAPRGEELFRFRYQYMSPKAYADLVLAAVARMHE